MRKLVQVGFIITLTLIIAYYQHCVVNDACGMTEKHEYISRLVFRENFAEKSTPSQKSSRHFVAVEIDKKGSPKFVDNISSEYQHNAMLATIPSAIAYKQLLFREKGHISNTGENVHISKNGILKFVGNVSCDPIFAPILLYNRIFKTGSTSLSNYMKTIAKKKQFKSKEGTTEDWYKLGNSYPYPESIVKHAERNKRLIYIGHFFFRNSMKINKPHTYINILRDPVDRIISHYRYMRNEKMRPKKRIIEFKKSGYMNESLLSCVEQQHRGCEDNVMTHFICGTSKFCNTGSKRALKQAKYNMKTYYAAVGVLEKIDTFLKVLRKRFPSMTLDSVQLHHDKGNSNDKNFVVDDSTREFIKIRNKADIELYKFALMLHEKQVKSCGI